MKAHRLCLLACMASVTFGCDGRKSPHVQAPLPTISKEESAGLRILADYATVLVATKGFPDLDHYQTTSEDERFREKLAAECPHAVEASVTTNTSAFVISSGSIETIGGEKTNKVNIYYVRERSVPRVTSCQDIIYEYTTLDGQSGSVPATMIVVEQTFGGHKLRLLLSTRKTQQ